MAATLHVVGAQAFVCNKNIHWPSVNFRSECCTGGGTMAAPPVNRARRLKVFAKIRPGIEPVLPAGRAQRPAPLSRSDVYQSTNRMMFNGRIFKVASEIALPVATTRSDFQTLLSHLFGSFLIEPLTATHWPLLLMFSFEPVPGSRTFIFSLRGACVRDAQFQRCYEHTIVTDNGVVNFGSLLMFKRNGLGSKTT